LSYNLKNKREKSKTKEIYFLMSIAKVFNTTLYFAKYFFAIWTICSKGLNSLCMLHSLNCHSKSNDPLMDSITTTCERISTKNDIHAKWDMGQHV
jgi:hypothetical protein